MSKDNLLEVLQNNGDLNDVKATTFITMKEVPVKTWNCTKDHLQEECYTLEHQFHRKANHVLYTEIPKLKSAIEDSVHVRQILNLPKTSPELTKFHEKEMERLQLKAKRWEVDMSNILYKDIYEGLLPYCEQEFKEHIVICLDVYKEIFTELRPMLDEFCERINCTLGWDEYNEQFGIRPNLSTVMKRVFEQKTNF